MVLNDKQVARVAVSRSPNDGGLTKFEMTPGGGANAGRSSELVRVVDIAAFIAVTEVEVRKLEGR